MIYLYGNENCPNCIKKEKELKELGIPFVKRDSSRIKDFQDEIDEEALVQASMQNMRLPIIVEIEEVEDAP